MILRKVLSSGYDPKKVKQGMKKAYSMLFFPLVLLLNMDKIKIKQLIMREDNLQKITNHHDLWFWRSSSLIISCFIFLCADLKGEFCGYDIHKFHHINLKRNFCSLSEIEWTFRALNWYFFFLVCIHMMQRQHLCNIWIHTRKKNINSEHDISIEIEPSLLKVALVLFELDFGLDNL